MTFERYLQDLGNEDKPLKHSDLPQLSSLSSEDLVEFNAVWLSLSTVRKNEILSELVELCEDNLDVDFTSVFRTCLGEADEQVRERATRGLWESDDRVIIRPIISLLNSDPSPKVRSAAATSLGKFAEMAQDGKLLSRDAERIQQALLSLAENKSEELEVRRRAIEAVASFNSPEIEEIIRDAYHNGDAELKQSSLYAMGKSSDSRWLPIVLNETHDQDAAIRYEAATACGQLGDESSVPHLIRLIKDEDFQVQLSAVHALGALGGQLAKQALLQCLKMEDEPLEQAAQAALDETGFDDDPLGFRFQT